MALEPDGNDFVADNSSDNNTALTGFSEIAMVIWCDAGAKWKEKLE